MGDLSRGVALDTAPYAGKLVVVLPIYNEELNIAKTVDSIFTQQASLAADLVVIGVNDGSRDRTGMILEQLRQRYVRLQVVHNSVNLGYGGALRAGFAAAKAHSPDAIFFMDADGQFEIADLVGMLPLLALFDGVFGYRKVRQDTLMRKLNTKAWGVFVRLLFGIRVRDVDCAFKVFRADFFNDLSLVSSGAMVSTELLARFVASRRRFTEVEVRHLPRKYGVSTGANWRVIARAFVEAFDLRMKLWRQTRFQ
jgi:glycosyltransferase involved in cell wall biosynthesis